VGPTGFTFVVHVLRLPISLFIVQLEGPEQSRTSPRFAYLSHSSHASLGLLYASSSSSGPWLNDCRHCSYRNLSQKRNAEPNLPPLQTRFEDLIFQSCSRQLLAKCLESPCLPPTLSSLRWLSSRHDLARLCGRMHPTSEAIPTAAILAYRRAQRPSQSLI
jgi:hypothetical protein